MVRVRRSNSRGRCCTLGLACLTRARAFDSRRAAETADGESIWYVNALGPPEKNQETRPCGPTTLVRHHYSSPAILQTPKALEAAGGEAILKPLHCPVIAVSASDDPGETFERMSDWQALAAGRFVVKSIPGTNHFSVMQPVVQIHQDKPSTPLYDLLLSEFGFA